MIISNSNAAKAKQKMGSYSHRGARSSGGGQVSQIYKNVFLQEGDELAALFYSGIVGGIFYIDDLEMSQTPPFTMPVVSLTTHDSGSDTNESLILGIKVDATLNPESEEYSNYTADLVFCYSSEWTPDALVPIKSYSWFSNLFAGRLDSDIVTVNKIYDRDWCDLLFTKNSIYFGMNGFNYFNNINETLDKPRQRELFMLEDVTGIMGNYNLGSYEYLSFDEEYIKFLSYNENARRNFYNSIFASGSDVIPLVTFKSHSFEEHYENHTRCCKLQILAKEIPDNYDDPSYSVGFSIIANCIGYYEVNDEFNINIPIAVWSFDSASYGPEYFMRIPTNTILNNSLKPLMRYYDYDFNFDPTESNPSFVNDYISFIKINKAVIEQSDQLSSFVYKTQSAIIGDGGGSIMMFLTIPSDIVREFAPRFNQNTVNNFEVAPLITIDGSGLPDSHPLYNANITLSAVSNAGSSSSSAIFTFSSYDPVLDVSGVMTVNIDYSSGQANITNFIINGTPIVDIGTDLAGLEWSMRIATACRLEEDR